jgi:CRP-like cAMP-binding protein
MHYKKVRRGSMPIAKTQVLQRGERTNPEGKPVRNKMLLSVPDTEYQVIRPHLNFLSLPHHLSLHEPHRTLKFVHFPNEGLISLVVELKEGKSVEAGLIGNEGAAGIPAVFGLSRSPLREIVQIAGSGFRVRVGTLKEILRSTPQLQMILSRFVMGLSMQVAQTAACNRLHNVEQRLARWLLIAHDRADSGIIPITHDFLATMLGTDRPSVTLAAGVLQRKQIIGYTRRAVRIMNRNKLEQFACECHAIVQQYNGGFD